MRIDRCYQIPPLCDVEVTMDVSIDWRDGEPMVSVDGIEMDGVDLFRHPCSDRHALFLQLAFTIADLAEDDDDLLDRLIADEGAAYRGLPNDPDGHWRVAR